MVELQFYKIDKNNSSCEVVAKNKLLFKITKPTVIQSSEIIKIKTGIILKVPDGHLLNIFTYPALADKACELFPNIIILDSEASEAEVQLAVRNSGRNQINLMIGEVIAVGHLNQVQDITIGEFEPNIVTNPKLPNTTPQKKNTFEFEVK